MSSAASGFSSARRRNNLKLAARIALLVAVVVVSSAAAVYYWIHSAATKALPRVEGSVSLEGLQAPVTVVRDLQGVPHITAAGMEDLFFAQGYVTAQDRFWEMDATRRFAAGELAAAFGSEMIEQDKAQRLLGLRYVAERAAANLAPRDRAYFEAYARGVNAYIAEHQYKLPLEFRVLRYFPRAWSVEDSFLIGAMMAQLLTHGNYLDELHHEAILAKLGPQLTADLYVQTSGRDLPPQTASNPGELPPPPPSEEERGAASLPSQALGVVSPVAPQLERMAPGSNNWVISGAHTASGKPLLSDDMHLPHRIPDTWYEVHLTSGEFDAAGVSVPGMPAVVVGHNRRIAWGFTSVMPDVEDVYIETFNERGEYLTPSGWQRPEVRRETIAVKRGRDVQMDVVVTRHGPVITPSLKGESRQVALRWTMYDDHMLSFPFFEVNAARNWQEFRAAFSRFGIPGQNVVYADVDGHIGYQATGMYPIRKAGDGSMPVNGSDDSYEWSGYVPFEQLPSVYDPETGMIATANGRVTPDGYPFVLTTEWGSPYRTERIYRMLRQNRKFTAADMLEIQTDVYSDLDRFVAERFVYAIDRTANASDRVRNAADLLRNWNGRMEKDSAAAALAQTARIRLQEVLLKSKLGDSSKLYTWWMSPVWLENTVLYQPSRWLPSGYSDWNALMTEVAESAISDAGAPRDLSKWKYGEMFPVEVKHPIFGNIPFLRNLGSSGKLPQSGNGVTVKQVGRAFGPSQRFTADLSNWDQSTMNLVMGQSGNIYSPHYKDHWPAWYEGKTFALPFSPGAVAGSKKHELTLVPAGR
ncbi:MAG TPA: penicillin acylase family protein [Clostridia bacterium]|nr:penicillin acylase family protein [Clostridia bacterium]